MRPPQAPRAVRITETVASAASPAGEAPHPAPRRAKSEATSVALPVRATPRPGVSAASPSLAARMGERAASTRRVLLRRAGIVAALLAGALAVAWLAFASPLLALDPARVVVTAPEGQVDLAAALAVVDAHAGTPLPRLDTRGIAASLEEIPSVRTAVIERQWPQGLAVAIEPRTGVVAVPSDEGFAVFDAEGVHITTVAAAPAGIPIVDVPIGEDTSRILATALAVLASLPEALRAEVGALSAATTDSIEFVLADGATVRWGDDSEAELKVSVLQTLRQVQAAYYDVSTPRRPITR